MKLLWSILQDLKLFDNKSEDLEEKGLNFKPLWDIHFSTRFLFQEITSWKMSIPKVISLSWPDSGIPITTCPTISTPRLVPHRLRPNPKWVEGKMQFLIFQAKTCPNTGSHHWQGYCIFRRSVRGSTAAKLMEIGDKNHCRPNLTTMCLWNTLMSSSLAAQEGFDRSAQANQ